MKKFIIFSVFIYTFTAQCDYYNFMLDENLQNQKAYWNGSEFINTNDYFIIELDEHEKFEVTFFSFSGNESRGSLGGGAVVQGSGYWRGPGRVNNFSLVYENEIWQTVQHGNNDLTLYGPGRVYYSRVYSQDWSMNVNAEPGVGYLTFDHRFKSKIRYMVSSNQAESKFSVSLDNDGDRVAMGYKEDGSNALIRVYEFDGSSWNQLGEDIE